jgi:hypothetical protein
MKILKTSYQIAKFPVPSHSVLPGVPVIFLQPVSPGSGR